MPISSYYDILGLPETASQEEIKQAYRMYCKKYHPDINSDPNAAAMFRMINEAYSALTTSEYSPHLSYSPGQATTEPAEEHIYTQPKAHICWWKIILRPFQCLLCWILAAVVWLLKIPITIIGAIGYFVAALFGIGMVFAAISALGGEVKGWPMVLGFAILGIAFYLLTLFSTFLLALLDVLRDWLLGL